MSGLFTQTTVPHEGQRLRGHMVRCGHCDHVSTVHVNSFRGSPADCTMLEERAAAKKFEEKGWKVGNSPRQHRCPTCYSAIKAASVRKSEEAKLQKTELLAAQPRQMTIDDRRIVVQKLAEVYGDSKTGYLENWTDAKVASDLGCPQAWVRDIRESNFGPENSNEELRKSVNDAKVLLADAKRIGPLAETMLADIKALLSRAEKIERTVIDLERQMRA